MISVMVVDDNPVVQMGLVALLETADDIKIVATARDGRQAIDLARQLRPDLVLLDVRMPDVDGIRAAGPLSAISRVLMLSYNEDPASIRDSIQAGACGYLVHGSFSPDELVTAVRDVVAGRANPLSAVAARVVVESLQSASGVPPAGCAGLGLSTREVEVMRLITQGRSNVEIAGELVLSEKTVKNHVSRIYAKLGVRTRAAAIARWLGTANP
ncbi:response regulator [Actinoallomurus rhizosphaericola]|uniref:response regulator n=1 Tax=Actinoallomurus rhizosphaericola TaxID=2952536 RepID=UPI0020906AB3|nr:response regulator transcription factor [Actinoallomurus rhizosphaericola]MCO5992693.1 response regulator transcription factor [Actinoallomurus rhizosphaericola]